MKTRLVTAVAIIGICFAWADEGGAATTETTFPGYGWITAERSASGVRVAQIDYCCVAARRKADDATECAFACNTMLDICTGILIRGGYPRFAFDDYTSDDCITFILNTPRRQQGS